MSVVHVDQGLEVSYFNHFSRLFLIFNQRIQLHRTLSVLSQQILNLLVVEQLILSQTQDFEGLLLRHEPSFDTEALLCNLLSAAVGKLLHEDLVVLFLEIL